MPAIPPVPDTVITSDPEADVLAFSSCSDSPLSRNLIEMKSQTGSVSPIERKKRSLTDSDSENDSDIRLRRRLTLSSDSALTDIDDLDLPDRVIPSSSRLSDPLSEPAEDEPSSSSRPKRAAASMRPGAYRIEPLGPLEEDEEYAGPSQSSLANRNRLPNGGRLKPKKVSRNNTISALLKEKLAKQAKGIDEEGFRRADAMIAEMDRERELTMLLLKGESGKDDFKRGGSYSRNGSDSGTSDSLVEWSGDEDGSLSSDDSFTSAPGTVEGQKSRSNTPTGMSTPKASSPAKGKGRQPLIPPQASPSRERIKSVLQAMTNDQEDFDALDIIERDVIQHRQIEQRRKAEQGDDQVVRFWRSGRVDQLDLVSFCSNPWEKDEDQHLHLGTLKFVYPRDPSKIEAIAKWAFFLSVLSEEFKTSFHALDLLDDLFEQDKFWDQQAAAARSILDDLPRLFAHLGAHSDVVQDCFALPDPLQEPVKVERSSEHRWKKAEERHDVPWLTIMRRTDVVSQLSKAIRSICRSQNFVGSAQDDRLVGLFVCLLFLRAEYPEGGLRGELRATMEALLTSRSPFSILSTKDESICDRIVGMLQGRSMCYRNRVVDAIPELSLRSRQMRRWVAWSIMMEGADADVRAAEYSPIIPSLSKLAEAIDSTDSQSHFYLGAGNNHANYEELCASTEILATALTDIALQICKSQAARDTPGTNPSPNRSPTRKGVSQHSQALEVALGPYHFLEPKRSGRRVTAMRTIVDNMQAVNSKIRDAPGDLARTKAKDALQRYELSVKYQTTMYAARPYTAEHHESLNLQQKGQKGPRPYRPMRDGGSVLSSGIQTPTPMPFQLSSSPTKPKQTRQGSPSKSRSPEKLVPEAGQSRIASFLRQPNHIVEVVIPARDFLRRTSAAELRDLKEELHSNTPLRVERRSKTPTRSDSTTTLVTAGPSAGSSASASSLLDDDNDIQELSVERTRPSPTTASSSMGVLRRRNADMPKLWRFDEQ